jgi:cytochrome c oxidase accessory protein FixG
MCPYARFQSAMFDKDTLVISYDEARGDPRGRRKRSVDPREAGLGDCIDCNMCVQVCPTGIDIREGLQYECIACAACIDVCDSVMERMDYPKGLIRYTSENSMVNKQPLRILRPRVLVYGALLLCLVIGFVLSIGARTPLRIDALRDRNTLYRELSGGEIENVFSLKVLNLDTVDHSYLISVEGIPGIRMDSDTEELVLEAGEFGRLVVRVRVDKGTMADSGGDILFRVQARSDPSMSDETNARFIGPSAGP